MSEIDDEQTIVLRAAEETDDERTVVEHGTIESVISLAANHRILAAERQQVAMQGQRGRVLASLVPVDLRAQKGDRVAGVRRAGVRLGANAWELRDEVGSSFANRTRERCRVIGEVEKRRRRTKVLALKEKRRLRQEQQQRCKGAVAARTRLDMKTTSACRIRDLIVILYEGDELRRREIER